LPLALAGVDELVQRPAGRQSQAMSLKKCPFSERGSVRRVEPLQKVVPVKGGDLQQMLHTLRSGMRRSVIVRADVVHQLVEASHIGPEIQLWRQRHLLAVNV